MVQLIRRESIALVCEKLLNQFVARVFGVDALATGLTSLLNRSERSRLDLDQRRGHEQEVTRDIDVNPIDLSQKSEILFGDLLDRNVSDVDFRPADQVEQKVQRTTKTVQIDLIILLEGHDGLIPRKGLVCGIALRYRIVMPRSSAEIDMTYFLDALRAEADAIERIAQRIERDRPESLAKAIDLLERCAGHVVVAGMGKSGLIGGKISATLSSLGIPSHLIHPADALHGDLGRIRRGDVALLLSYSGETEELVNFGAVLLSRWGVPRGNLEIGSDFAGPAL